MKQMKSLILPFSALFVVPGLILLLTKSTMFGFNMFSAVFQVVVGSLVCLAGLTLVVTTIRMFVVIGKGTLAPWDPTTRLITEGVYAHMRNPMISGVLLTLLGESLFFGSLGILLWSAFFFLGNTIYFHYSEEKGLMRRFGDEYTEYRNNVPMWIPRMKPWKTTDKDEH